MEALGKNIADEWISEIVAYYCKKYNKGAEEVLQMLIEVNEKIVMDFCQKHFDMIERENAVAEVENQGFTVEGN